MADWWETEKKPKVGPLERLLPTVDGFLKEAEGHVMAEWWKNRSLWGRIAAGAAVLAFLWLIWPTPYTYGSRSGTPYRMNRFTGVIQYASRDGWR